MASEPAYVTAFKEFTKSSLTVDDIGPMEEEFYGQNDRACGILFGSYVDSALVSAIKSVMRPDLSNALSGDLFDYEGPIGTFSARINLAYALALFGKKTKHDLDLIRLMRNQFAHCRLPLRFDMPAVANVCAHLQIPDTQQATHPFVFASFVKTIELMDTPLHTDPHNPKRRFIVSCHTIVHGLLNFGTRKNRTPLQSSPLP
jgi:hypothetical protein